MILIRNYGNLKIYNNLNNKLYDLSSLLIEWLHNHFIMKKVMNQI